MKRSAITVVLLALAPLLWVFCLSFPDSSWEHRIVCAIYLFLCGLIPMMVMWAGPHDQDQTQIVRLGLVVLMIAILNFLFWLRMQADHETILESKVSFLALVTLNAVCGVVYGHWDAKEQCNEYDF